MPSAQEALKSLDESPTSGFQFKMVITAGMGFFTDAYDLFIIGVVSSLLKETWHIASFEVSLLSSVALLAAALGAILFGRIADRMGRKFIYGLVSCRDFPRPGAHNRARHCGCHRQGGSLHWSLHLPSYAC